MLIYAALKSCGYFVKIFCTLYECYLSSSLQDVYYFFLTGGEIDYVKILNRVLPNDIRVMGWSPAPTDFSARYLISCHLLPITFADRIFMAFLNEEKKFQFEQEVNRTQHDINCRFSCLSREYKYFFWRENLDIMVCMSLFMIQLMRAFYLFTTDILYESEYIFSTYQTGNGNFRKEIYRGTRFQKFL